MNTTAPYDNRNCQYQNGKKNPKPPTEVRTAGTLRNGFQKKNQTEKKNAIIF
jgi:hypothetical protein